MLKIRTKEVVFFYDKYVNSTIMVDSVYWNYIGSWIPTHKNLLLAYFLIRPILDPKFPLMYIWSNLKKIKNYHSSKCFTSILFSGCTKHFTTPRRLLTTPPRRMRFHTWWAEIIYSQRKLLLTEKLLHAWQQQTQHDSPHAGFFSSTFQHSLWLSAFSSGNVLHWFLHSTNTSQQSVPGIAHNLSQSPGHGSDTTCWYLSLNITLIKNNNGQNALRYYIGF